MLTSESEVDRYREGVAHLLKKQIDAVGDCERWLDAPMDVREASARAVLKEDPTGTFRTMGALLMRKARLHMIAMQYANENNNVHSLAVQMRPVLECADQVVLIFHNLIIEQEHGEGRICSYMNEDFYRTIIRMTQGEVDNEQLIKMISEASGMPLKEVVRKKRRRNDRRLKHTDKITYFEGSKDWYDYLSKHFHHDGYDWRGDSWRGGINSMNTDRDKFTFAGLMDYLVNRVAVMNAYVALCPIAGAVSHEQINATLAQLQEVHTMTKVLRNSAESAIANPDQQRPD